MRKGEGKIITFYSYKGGTGRSMALANIAWILASRGKRVLLVDWDLEAPGLHRYFHPFIKDKNLTSTEGLIDLVMRFEDAAVRPSQSSDAGTTSPPPADWYLSLAKIDRYVLPLAWPFDGEGALDLMSAGKQDPSYALRVNSFNWAGFYDRLGGGVFLEAVKREMKEKYHYILIDSRTGVSDTAGICTVQMPDMVVVCFTYNIQSIEGVAAVAGSIRSQRGRADITAAQGGALRIFPVPMRVERSGDKERLERAREFAQSALSGFLDHLGNSKARYWGQVDVPYDPFYAFQEILATVADPPGVRDSVLTSFEQLTFFLTEGKISEQAPLPREKREVIKALFLRGVSPLTVASVAANKPELQALYDAAITAQKSWLESDRDKRYLLDSGMVAQLEEAVELLVALLQDPEFHTFWEEARANLRRQRVMHTSYEYSGVAIVLTGMLGAFITQKSIEAVIPESVAYFAFMFVAGMLGAAVDSLRLLHMRVDDTPREYTRALDVSSLLHLLGGGFTGLLAALLLDANTSRALPGFDSIASWSPFIGAFIVGMVSRNLVPDLITRVDVEKRPPAKIGHG